MIPAGSSGSTAACSPPPAQPAPIADVRVARVDGALHADGEGPRRLAVRSGQIPFPGSWGRVQALAKQRIGSA
jgi:hypothetical protein